MNHIEIRLLRPGDLFTFFDGPGPSGKPDKLGLCVSNTPYEAEGGGFGHHVRCITPDHRLKSLFWKHNAIVGRHEP